MDGGITTWLVIAFFVLLAVFVGGLIAAVITHFISKCWDVK